MASPSRLADPVAYLDIEAESEERGKPSEERSTSGERSPSEEASSSEETAPSETSPSGEKKSSPEEKLHSKKKPHSTQIDSIKDAISLSGLEENVADLQLDQVSISDGNVLGVQVFSESSDFTATVPGQNVTTNTIQEFASMQASPFKEEMVLCSGDENQEALEKKRTRADAIASIRARTQVRLARMEVPFEGGVPSQTSEQDLQSQIRDPAELSGAPAVEMESGQAPKKKKKKKKKKFKKLLLDDDITDSSNKQELNKASTSARVTSVQAIFGAASNDIQAGLNRCEDLSECSPSMHTADPKTEQTSSTKLGIDLAILHVPYNENGTQVDHNIAAQTHEDCSTERGLGTGTQEQSYRDALMGILDRKGTKRVSSVDPTIGVKVIEHNDALHAHPPLNTNGERPKANEDALAEPCDESAGDAPTSISGQNEERSGTEPSTCAQSTRHSHSGRKSKIPVREKLSPIKEASSETIQDIPPEDLHSYRAESRLTCTPKSSKTTWTDWTSAEPQGTPKTESSEIVSPNTENPHQKSSVDTKFGVSSQARGSHAHPSSSVSIDKPSQPTSTTQPFVTVQKPEGFFWQLDGHGFPCAKEGCEKRCNLWDGSTVICPRCGPFSETRYCCKEHLLDDIKWHWLDCGQMTFEHPCRENSIPQEVRDGPPLVPCLHPYDTPERHRQAVYFNAKAREGDYFIFADWADLVEAGFPEHNLGVRCANRVIYSIKFDDANEKDRFRRVLATCLFMTIEVTELVDYLFRLIRDKLRSQNVPPDIETALKYQFHEEFCVTIQQQITGERHACLTDWDGRNRRNCHDAVCRAEYRRLLGSLGGKGHCQLIDHLEGSYWILRAARTTHPNVTDAKARMLGEGFSEVADGDRREFRRGAGWDGAGTGDMEIEGIND